MVASLHWFGHVQRMEVNRIPKKVLYMNLEATRLRGTPWNKQPDEVREDGRQVGGKGWKERVYNREERKKILRTAGYHRILHMAMEWMNAPLLSHYWSCLWTVHSLLQGHTNPRHWSPRELNFVWRQLIFVGPQNRTCSMSFLQYLEILK